MSKYTTEVRYLVETANGLDESTGYSQIDALIEGAVPKIFDFDFPIFDEAYRPVLCKKILKHYYLREIGFETVGLWKYYLNTTLNEIMPYYNKLYQSELLEFKPFDEIDLKVTHNGTNKTTSSADETFDNTHFDTDTLEHGLKTVNAGTTNVSGETTNNGTLTREGTGGETSNTTGKNTDSGTHSDLYSDTPQGKLLDVKNASYLTNARYLDDSNTTDTTVSVINETTTNQSDTTTGSGTSKSDTTTNNTMTNSGKDITTREGDYKNTIARDSTVDGTTAYIESRTGKASTKSYMELLKEYRESFLNIDMMVINDLANLFMLIY